MENCPLECPRAQLEVCPETGNRKKKVKSPTDWVYKESKARKADQNLIKETEGSHSDIGQGSREQVNQGQGSHDQVREVQRGRDQVLRGQAGQGGGSSDEEEDECEECDPNCSAMEPGEDCAASCPYDQRHQQALQTLSGLPPPPAPPSIPAAAGKGGRGQPSPQDGDGRPGHEAYGRPYPSCPDGSGGPGGRGGRGGHGGPGGAVGAGPDGQGRHGSPQDHGGPGGPGGPRGDHRGDHARAADGRALIRLFLVILVCIISVTVGSITVILFHPAGGEMWGNQSQIADACCSFPCQHKGVCVSLADGGFLCDCTNTQYGGPTCESPTPMRGFLNWLLPPYEKLIHIPGSYPWLWKIINSVHFLHQAALKYVYMSRHRRTPTPPAFSTVADYTTLDVHFNKSYFGRALPPVPPNCPTPMGVAGRKQLPSPDDVFDRVFSRSYFRPCPHGTNLFFISYGQFLIHQFYKTDFRVGAGVTWGNNQGVDMSQLYGSTTAWRRALRTLQGGRMKTSTVNGEDVLPKLEDIPGGLPVAYPEGRTLAEMLAGPSSHFYEQGRQTDPKYASGHPLGAMTPMLLVVGTLWIREHNRVCDRLAKLYPHWDDERLYQTARLYITGLHIQLTIGPYVQHLSQYLIRLEYKPELLHDSPFQTINTILQEFVYLYDWHMMVPDVIKMKGEEYNVENMVFGSHDVVFKNGFNTFVDAMFRTSAGLLGPLNCPNYFAPLVKRLIEHSRQLRLQSFNRYRQLFDLPPYTTFEDLTKDKHLAKELEDLYGDIDAVEYFVGLISEHHTFSVTPPSMVAMGGAWSIKGLMANVIGTKEWWKPSTFGGEELFNEMRSTTLMDWVCRNLRGKDPCAGMHVAFAVPEDVRRAGLRDAAIVHAQRLLAKPKCRDRHVGGGEGGGREGGSGDSANPIRSNKGDMSSKIDGKRTCHRGGNVEEVEAAPEPPESQTV